MQMSELPKVGKISPEIFNELIFPRLGSKDEGIMVGPQHGVDVAIVEIGNKAVSFTCDPIFIVPEYGWEKAAWFALHIIASDSVTSGLKPKYLSIDLNLPVEMTKEQLAIVWDVIHSECKKLGIAIVTGHTARYENCHYPMVGGATMVGIGEKDEYVTPSLARVGDKVIITKGPAIEASGIFASMFPQLMENEFGTEFNRKAQQLFFKMSVVEDALTAISIGVRDNGVSSMHDATECGIWGALYEVAQAAHLGIRVEKEKILIEDCVGEICKYFGIDPYASISEGTLIITCREHKAKQVVQLLNTKGIKSSIVGELTEPEQGMIIMSKGKEGRLEHPRVDPFWGSFHEALGKYKI
jgi:hydrogenase expression/formation protein HypE